MVGNIAD